MAITPKDISTIIEVSREVIADSALGNGAIVAANTDKPYVPKHASDYRYVWIRDASFSCVAADYLGIAIQEPFFRWVNERPEDFIEDELLYSNYSTNGRIATMGKIFMADQSGALLWAMHEHFHKNPKQAEPYRELIHRLANGIAKIWNKTFFSVATSDIWEESHRQTSTRFENNFTYSLAACARGLLLANDFYPNHFWKETAMQMMAVVDHAYDAQKGYFLRNTGKVSDPNVDASLLGLVWPFGIYDADDERMVNTVAMMEKRLVNQGGVHRFEFDYFDSEGSSQEGGGAWPLLNCWMAIYWHTRGNNKKAHQYFDWVVEHSKKFRGFLPEQFFDDFRIGIYPLVWSHAMFVIVAKKLGYL
ncbi:MAG: glycoside hydrolase family 15 protein [Patescibacteria group bacterium]|jgi:GH15 family glucan-1,4-alpha-glucosidase